MSVVVVVVVVSRLIDPAVGYLLLGTRGFCDDARISLTVCTEGGICGIYWRLYSVTSSRICTISLRHGVPAPTAQRRQGLGTMLLARTSTARAAAKCRSKTDKGLAVKSDNPNPNAIMVSHFNVRALSLAEG